MWRPPRRATPPFWRKATMSPEKPAALIIDDDDTLRTRVCRAFQLRGWEAYGTDTAAAALRMAQEHGPELAIVDLRLPGESGLDIIRALRNLDATISIIMLTGYGSIATALEAIKGGADHYLTKPVDVDQILSAYEALRATPPAEQDLPETVPSLARVEWEHIQRVLTDCKGNVSQAARLLGLHRRSLQRKLSKYPPRV
jgi:two-component system, response regulator RegA